VKSFIFYIVVGICLALALFAYKAGSSRAMAPEPKPAVTPSTMVRHSPMLGRIEMGAYAPEAAINYGIDNPCLMTLDDNETYTTYRKAVRESYGADLSDMNYLGLGMPGWQSRYQWFENWLLRAAQYGDPTIALEPIGKGGYGIFKDSPEMRRLRQAFEKANDAGVTVWVRFASESNDPSNPYTVCGSPKRIAQFRRSVRWFRAYMPSNVRLVFSPLLNDLFIGDMAQLPRLKAMYMPGDYDRIGGTLYATTSVSIDPSFTWYYNYMRKLDPKTRFQICELGGTFENQAEVSQFLRNLKAGKWPTVDRVNLFAGELNPTAIENHGHFGLVLPGERKSYLCSIIGQQSSHTGGAQVAQATVQSAVRDNSLADANDVPLAAPIATMPEDGNGWRSDAMTLVGKVIAANAQYHTFVILVSDVTDSSGEHVKLSPPRKKRVYLEPTAMITSSTRTIDRSQLDSLKGAVTEVTGWDRGTGTPQYASTVTIDRR